MRENAEIPAPTLSVRSVVVVTLLTAVVLGGLWATDLLLLDTGVLTTFRGQQAASPVYAFWRPLLRPAGALFVVACVVLGCWTPRLLETGRTPKWLFLTVLATASLLLPFTLFLVRAPAARLGGQFQIYRGEEYFEDAMGIRDLGGFLARYTELTPQLSTHGRTHPPGNAAYLYLTSRVFGRSFGRSTLAAGVSVLICFAAGMFFAYCGLATVLEDSRARLAALLALASPSVLDFACTSMDAVFFSAAALALWPGLKAFAERRFAHHSWLAGAALFLAMLFSFTALPVGFFLLVFALAQIRTLGWREVLLRLLAVLLGFLGSAVLFAWLTGFEIWECFFVARQEHFTQMTRFIGQPPREVYAYVAFGNTAGFLIGAGLAVVPIFGLRVFSAVRGRERSPLLIASVATLIVLCAGGIYTMEVERIWIFMVPLLAGAALTGKQVPDAKTVPLVLAVGWLQALVMEVLLFTLW